jgi:hypothetical protein
MWEGLLDRQPPQHQALKARALNGVSKVVVLVLVLVLVVVVVVQMFVCYELHRGCFS